MTMLNCHNCSAENTFIKITLHVISKTITSKQQQQQML
jgi:hypothetical protein